MEDEALFITLVQQYATQFGITFNSQHLDDEEKKSRLISLIQLALSGERGAITDQDLE